MKKKVLFIVPNLHCGGASKVLSLICQNLDPAGFEVVLVCVNTKKAFYPITNPAVKVIDLQKDHVKSIFFPIQSVFKKEKPDIVFSNGQDLNILMAFLKIFHPKIAFVCRETSVLSGNNKNIPFRRLYNFLVKKLYNNVNRIICQSREMAADLEKMYHVRPEKLQIVSNPVTVPQLPVPLPALFKTGKIRFLSIGRLDPGKGNMRVLEALASYSHPFEFIILGDGPEKAQLEHKAAILGISDSVVFKGTVANTNEYIADCNFVLLGTYNEGFPNIVLEAGILGKPVIAFKVPGVDEEVIVPYETGILITGNTPAHFTEALNGLQTVQFDSELIKSIIINKFGIKKIMQTYEILFDKIIQ
ncbi:glycosyltransferase [Ferruginibacter sp. HRS2-29]|uniref:glycosyltransferase n=1 Tax=Ferruginibacter sp. HRS2-29 TaxID=2487334 RepID=UPI0020CD8B21|nr:glycosyltransferase [Ferruginibacter sp. HRS2-29]MCP9749915.1 glycosyltransferase [Ferruginibacter sp. HRS2-29]